MFPKFYLYSFYLSHSWSDLLPTHDFKLMTPNSISSPGLCPEIQGPSREIIRNRKPTLSHWTHHLPSLPTCFSSPEPERSLGAIHSSPPPSLTPDHQSPWEFTLSSNSVNTGVQPFIILNPEDRTLLAGLLTSPQDPPEIPLPQRAS